MKVSKYINPNIIQDGSIDGDKKIKEYPPLKEGSGSNSVCQDSCSATRDYSHAEGEATDAVGRAAHAEGSCTMASGWHSHAEGSLTYASGAYSHAEGRKTTASNNSEHAEGTYNISIPNKTIHTIGIGGGTSNTDRKNAHEIHLDGKHYIYGIGGYDGTNSQKEGIKTVQEVVAEAANAVQITYTELKSLRDAGTLVPGQQYRITDYTCTTTQSGTKSAGHQFDIIVTADDESTLNEEARAALHSGDEYFSGCSLNAWKLWYCLDNDTNRFAWADATNGKGVIYRMIDEFGNDCPYDFNNIQFYRKWNATKSLWCIISSDNTGVPCYTFSSRGDSSTTLFTDYSLASSNNVYSNVIRKYVNGKKQTLNNNCFFGDDCYSNTFGNDCSRNTFGNDCSRNTFGNDCSRNTFGNDCYSNTFGDNCCYNAFGNYCKYNAFGNDCGNNTFGNYCGNNTFGNYYSSNTFGNNCLRNTFGNDCGNNTFGNNCYSNTFGNSCIYIKFASDISASTKYNYYQNNYFGDGCQYIVFTGAATASSVQQVQNYNFAQGLRGTSSAYLTIDGVRGRSFETKVAKKSNGEVKIYCEADLIL